MFTYKGGTRVGKGTYWNLREGVRMDIADEDILPGNSASSYLRMPLAAMLISGPFVGLIYAVLMPIIGIGTVATLAVRGILRGIYNLSVKTVSFGWRPGDAYLSGKNKKKDRKPPEGN